VVLETDGENQFDPSCEKMKDYTESRKKRTSYIQYYEGRLIGLVTFCVGTAFSKTLLKER